MVQQVKSFQPELEVRSLGDVELLDDGGVYIILTVLSQVAKGARERSDMKRELLTRSGHKVRGVECGSIHTTIVQI